MSAEFAIALFFLVTGSCWACWRLGFEKGQCDTIKQFSDYCDRRNAEQLSTLTCRDTRQS
jgi:hypothetical protein